MFYTTYRYDFEMKANESTLRAQSRKSLYKNQSVYHLPLECATHCDDLDDYSFGCQDWTRNISIYVQAVEQTSW